MDDNINKIKEAMLQFGCRGKVTVNLISPDRYEVKINGDYFGIYDTVKETFVN